MKEVDYLWDHWKFNADQRLKAFNFFVVFSVFANGGLFTAIEKCAHPVAIIVVGIFISLLATVFWMVDTRSRELIGLSVDGLKVFECGLTDGGRIFHRDANAGRFVRYTTAFRILFVAQLLLGIFVIAYGVATGSRAVMDSIKVPAIAQCRT